MASNLDDKAIIDWSFFSSTRVRHRLPYPANVARNVARSAAESEYVLGSDVALLPSGGFADKFIDFVKSSEGQGGHCSTLS